MTQSYSQIVKQIELLKAKADSARKREADAVIGRIKEAIVFYRLTAEELGLTASGSTPARKVAANGRGPSGKRGKAAASAKYRDESGNVWGGRGPRPAWLRAALTGGAKLEEFLASGGVSDGAGADSATTAKAVPARKRGRKAAKAKSVPKYKGEDGQAWSGRGPRPRWLVQALTDGKTLESMAV